MEDKPVDLFLPFSIADPDGSTREGHGIQRRNRRVVVCIPCRRRKLKCDKSQPCSRCVASGAPGECVYQQSPGQKQEAEPLIAPQPQTGALGSELSLHERLPSFEEPIARGGDITGDRDELHGLMPAENLSKSTVILLWL